MKRHHPAATLFPLMTGPSYEEFKADIQKNGVRDPISVLPDGTVLDGRNRLRACQDLGIECPECVEDPDSPLEFVLSRNLQRRQLTTSQKAVVAAKAVPLFAQEAQERMSKGGKTAGRGRPRNRVASKEATLLRADRTATILGKMFGVGRASVERAASVLKKAPKLAAAVENREMSLGAAYAETSGHKRKVRDRKKPSVPAVGTKRRRNFDRRDQQRIQKLAGMLDGICGILEHPRIQAALIADHEHYEEWVRLFKLTVKRIHCVQHMLKVTQ